MTKAQALQNGIYFIFFVSHPAYLPGGDLQKKKQNPVLPEKGIRSQGFAMTRKMICIRRGVHPFVAPAQGPELRARYCNLLRGKGSRDVDFPLSPSVRGLRGEDSATGILWRPDRDASEKPSSVKFTRHRKIVSGLFVLA